MLSIRNLTKSFGKNTVLKDVSLDVGKGEVVVALGRSGCGKSTLLRCINGLETIESGEIILNDELIVKDGKTLKDWRETRKRVGMVFQSYDLFPHMNVIDNITLGALRVEKKSKSDAQNDAIKLLERVGLSDKRTAYPRELSGGQKQRVAICRALCMNPDVLLLDEITAALDPEMVREVLDVIRGLRDAGLTMIIVTHEMKFAEQIADKIVYMDNGQILEISSPSDFFAAPKSSEAQKFLNIHFDGGILI